MARVLSPTSFDMHRIYAAQPDAIVCELGSLSEWLELTSQLALHDLARNDAITYRAERAGITSVYFGHCASPAVARGSEKLFYDIVVHEVGNCQRPVLDLLAASRFATPSARIFVAEALSPFAKALRTRYPRLLASQYAPEAEVRQRIYPIPHQDLMQLNLPSGSFDVALSIEVLEHVPSLPQALSEMARILVPGGMMLATFPFLWTTHLTERKAELVDGQVRHLVDKPEYHDDPMSPEGVLVFQLPGWDIIEMAKAAGFRTAKLVFYSSAIGGIIGINLIGRFVFVCER